MQAWNEFLLQLEKEWGSEPINRWLRSLKVIRFDAANLYLEPLDSFQVSWFEEHVRPKLLKQPLVNNNGRPIRIHLVPCAKKESIPQESRACHENGARFISPNPLDPEMSLDHFCVAPQNDIAFQLISDISNSPFNPTFLHGPQDSGKTHLLMSAAKILQQSGKNVFYVHAERFTEHVVQAIRQGKMQELRRSYRSVDVLIVDEIHFLSRKAASQEEFFHTFNHLHTQGSPILLSSRFPPSKLSDIEPRLVSRFEWGIVIGMEQIDARTILEKKAALWNFSLTQDLISYLLEKFPSSPLRALAALAIRSKTTDRISPPVAEKLLKDLLEREAQDALTPEKIIKAVALHYGIPSSELFGKSQTRESVLPRQVAMFLCREKLKLPFQKIGDIFSKDHSTVMASVRLVQKGIDEKKIELFL